MFLLFFIVISKDALYYATITIIIIIQTSLC